MARVMIVGGAGFIGSHLAARCIKRGDEVHVVVRPETCLERLNRLEGHYALHVLRLQDREALARCITQSQPTQVFHLAAHTRRREEPAFHDVFRSITDDLLDLIGLLAALSDARSPPQTFVRTGSLAEYGRAPAPFIESQREQPLNAYAAALTAGAHYAHMMQPRLAFPVTTARLALTYGPAQSDTFLIPGLIRRCLEAEPSRIWYPHHRRDLLYVDDAVDALCALAREPVSSGGIINIATGVATTVYETAQLILAATGAGGQLIEFDWNGGDEGIPDFRACATMAQELLGWRARVGLPEGIDRTVAWFRKQMLQPEVAHASSPT